MSIKKLCSRKHVLPLLAFMLPFLISVIILVGKGVYPFGKNCVLHMDMYHQYCPFFTEFLRKLKNADSLMYTWNIGLGSDFFSVYVYYLASPLNWLILLCPTEHVIEFMTILIVLKVSACGLTFFWYLKEHFQLEKISGGYKEQAFYALAFSTAYAFSGFVAAYSWDIMWMDCVALAPLIILGLERLVKENKPALYYVTLSLSILSNYYLSIMICLFLCLDFLLLFLEQKKNRIRAITDFTLYSLLAGGTGVIMMLPEMKILGYSGSSGFQFPEKVEWYFNIFAELARTSVTAAVYEADDHWPNLYVGVFTLLLLGLYTLNTRIPLRKKLPRLALVVFFVLSFANNWLDFIWHGLHFPDSLPGRQAFLFAFFVLVLGFETLMRRSGTKQLHVAIVTVVGAAVLLAGAWYGDEEITEVSSVLATIALLFCYGAAFVLYQLMDRKQKKRMAAVVFAVAILELAANMWISGYYVSGRTNYMSRNAAYEKLLEAAETDALEQAGADTSEQVFYRVEDTERFCKNDDTRFGYASATQFSSLMNVNVSHFFQKFYMEGGKNYYCYNGATPLLSAMLSVGYVISDCTYEESELRTFVAEADGYYLYRNLYTLPLGFAMSEAAVEEWEDMSEKKISAINRAAEILGAQDKLLEQVYPEVVADEGETIITLEEDGYYYGASEGCTADSLTFSYPRGKKLSYSKTTHTYLFDMGSCEAGEQITITNSKTAEIGFKVYKLNLNALEEAYATLNQSTLQTEKVTSTEILGTVQMEEDGRLILSVAAEEGWTLWVDGKKTEITSFADTFISVPLEKGEHAIRLTYQTPGLVKGAAVTAVCAALALVLLLWKRKRASSAK